MTFNLMFLLYLVAVIINNHVTLSNARQLKNPSNEDKQVVIETEHADPSKNNKKPNDENEVVFTSENVEGNEAAKMGMGVKDEKHPLPLFPFPFPWPMQPPVGGLPFPPPYDVPMIPPLPFPPFSFPPFDIPGIVPSPPV
ncbi:PREDICTED: cyclin-dependent kinase 12-like isoform X1 [Lupinus angustifolius]|uniref:cyclin-dependent kinase 12-like isoform X1 n=1 Tax=Lupinus angustifolius TaxID=3871 RepID=UPI00092F06FB|nr:PREDICTED: cyclin-dependent kinase 12-like isoform X1 [Lupinus angustifolius]